MIGKTLGPYQILAELGRGGMGEVYRARDTKLNRDVALKILPDAFATDADRLTRFRREAQVLASLNHPNVAQIYGFEDAGRTHALVMELVEGPTLADRIAHGPLSPDDAIPIAKQIAEALEAAHEAGVVHRDLKPANVKVRDDGTVKVLDFGLAKAMGPEGSAASDPANSPTMTSPASHLGMIIGTAAYMAPEQAKGRVVDRRADIWAFGVVCYEMLTGRRLFQGEDVSETLASVLRQDVVLSALPDGTPPAVRALVARCLQRDPRKRLSHISEARIVLEDPAAASAIADVLAPAAGAVSSRRLVMAIALTAMVVGTTGAVAWWLKPAPAVVNVTNRFSVELPETQRFTRTGRRFIAISPDGRRLAYIANQQIYLRELNELTAKPVAGTNEDPLDLTFSPDGESLAYFVPTPQNKFSLKKIRATGGTPLPLCPTSFPFGVTWQGETIAFAQNAKEDRGIRAVAATGGAPTTLVTWNENEMGAHPQLLTGGRVLFTVRQAAAASWLEAEVVVQTTGIDGRTVLVSGASSGRVVAGDRLVYARGGTLYGVKFDSDALAVRGGPAPVVEGLRSTQIGGGSGASQYGISDNGTLAFVAGGPTDGPRQIVWVDRQGKEEVIQAPSHSYYNPHLSRDGTKFVVEAVDGEDDLWVWRFTPGNLQRLTFGPADENRAVWTADGRHVIFNSGRTILRVDEAATQQPEVLFSSERGLGSVTSLSRDDRTLVFQLAADLMTLGLDGADRKPKPLLEGPYSKVEGVVSPNGRWMAYASSESGQFEVFVRPFPGVAAGHKQVSTSGGTYPRWSRAGDELFFATAPAGAGPLARAAVVTSGPEFTHTKPEMLFPLPGYGSVYDVSLDGKRFLMTRDAPTEDGTAGRQSITVVTHWIDELKARVK